MCSLDAIEFFGILIGFIGVESRVLNIILFSGHSYLYH